MKLFEEKNNDYVKTPYASNGFHHIYGQEGTVFYIPFVAKTKKGYISKHNRKQEYGINAHDYRKIKRLYTRWCKLTGTNIKKWNGKRDIKLNISLDELNNWNKAGQ